MILIKEGIGLTSGFVRMQDKAIIPASEVKIQTDSDNPIIMDIIEMNKAIGKALSGSRIEILKTTDIDNMKTNFNQFIKANAGLQHKANDIVDIEYNGADPLWIQNGIGIIETYLFDGTNYLKVSKSIELFEEIRKEITEFNRLLRAKADESEVFKKDGSTPMNAGYQENNAYDVVIKQTLDSVNANIQASIQALSTRIAAAEKNPANQYIEAQRIYNASPIIGLMSPDSNSVRYDLSGIAADDGNNFDFSDSKDLTFWFQIDGTDTARISLDIKVSNTIPQDFEVKKDVFVSVLLNTSGVMQITKEAGESFVLSALKIIEIKEDILAKADGLVKTADLGEYQKAAAPSLTTNAKTIIAAINELKTKTDDITNKQDNVKLKDVRVSDTEQIVIKEDGYFSSKDTTGNRRVAKEDDHLVDKKFVLDEIKNIPAGGGGGLPNLDTIPVLADPNGAMGNTFKIDNDVSQISFGSKEDIHRSYVQLQLFTLKGYRIYLIDKFKTMTTPEALILVESNGMVAKWIVGIKVMEGLQ